MVKRAASEATEQRNQGLLEEIKTLKGLHPFWGYRRIWAYLKYRQGRPVNKKRIYRLMKKHQFLVTKNQRLRARRGPVGSKPRADLPDQFWGVDMTKIKITSWGWLYLVIVLDWYTKEIIGYSLSPQSKTQDWLNALEAAVNLRFPQGIKDTKLEPLALISDNGCQPTSLKFMQACAQLNIKQIFTTWSNPKGNADTERVMRTLKEDLVWTYDWDNPFEFENSLAAWVKDYNEDFPHQALKYLTPRQRYETYYHPEPALT